MADWDFEKNTIDPSAVAVMSNKEAFWICPKGHQYSKAIYKRASGENCPACAHALRTSFPEQCFFYYIKKIYPDAINSYRDIFDNGMELFIHIGMNTVELEGEGFDAYVKEGDRVSRGDTLITFDIQTLKNKGYSVISPVIITNTEDFKEIRRTADGGINYYEELLETKK